MENKGVATLKRDVDAILIPVGTAITLPVGTQVVITQEQGGFFTVYANGHLARIEGKDAAALGKEPVTTSSKKKTPDKPKISGEVDETLIKKQLKTCYDPEISVDIVELGLVYDYKIEPIKKNNQLIGNLVHVQMTLTSPGCGMGPIILKDVEDKLYEIPNVTDVKVELVFDPPWDQSRMSDEAKLTLGLM